jgi:hypothetical protein
MSTEVTPLTAQEIFDKVATHLLRQGRRSVGGDGCAYRGEGGSKCAAGILIPDDAYDPEFEGVGVHKPADYQMYSSAQRRAGEALWRGLRAGGASEEHVEILRSLQNLHDIYESHNWRDRLRVVAADHGLSPAVLDQAEAAK